MFKLYFRILVIASVALYVIWGFLPRIESHFYSPETIDALSWAHVGRVFSWEALSNISYAFLIAYGVVSIGLIYFKPWARLAFLWLTILSVVSSFFYGITVLTELSTVYLQVMSIIDGFILALVYFSSLSKEFKFTHNKRMQSDRPTAGR